MQVRPAHGCRVIDETYIRVGGTWRYLWRAIGANGQMVDFRLTAGRDAKAAKALINKAIEHVRLHRPVTICTDKAQSYQRVIRQIDHRYDPHFDSIRHIDRKWRNNLIESDHAAMKRLLGYRQSFRSLRSAKVTLNGIETIRTIKQGHVHQKQPGVGGRSNSSRCSSMTRHKEEGSNRLALVNQN
ncbi:IS6 family transposase [Aliiroseovarius sp. YM-037]|uniref:IS6 family transposase n=1 Tax=Aliiroseovarius sp. YM-037 TaxID=3341728 RepID=UPI003A80A34F